MKTTLDYKGLFAALAVTALTGFGCQSPQQSAKRPGPVTIPPVTAAVAVSSPTKESQAALSPQQALAALRAGNTRFVLGQPLRRDLRAEVKATAAGQYPMAVVLSCIDSRQPIEMVLDQG